MMMAVGLAGAVVLAPTLAAKGVALLLLVVTLLAMFIVAPRVGPVTSPPPSGETSSPPASAPITPKAQYLYERFGRISSMSGAQFEIFVAQLMRAMGHGATVLGGAGDQGVDVIVHREEDRVAVQCKNLNRPVGNRPVQEVFTGKTIRGCSEAWVVAPMGYTPGAYEAASKTGVKLFNGGDLLRWIRQVEEAERKQDRPT